MLETSRLIARFQVHFLYKQVKLLITPFIFNIGLKAYQYNKKNEEKKYFIVFLHLNTIISIENSR